MSVRKGTLFGLVPDCGAVNQQVKAMPLPHPNLEQAVGYLKGDICFASLDLL